MWERKRRIDMKRFWFWLLVIAVQSLAALPVLAEAVDIVKGG
jgi:hypothetical protein